MQEIRVFDVDLEAIPGMATDTFNESTVKATTVIPRSTIRSS